MSNDKTVSEHYLHGSLLEAIQLALGKLGKTPQDVSIEDLAPVDEFHVGGRGATEQFLNQLAFSERDHVLDVGCGLGGAARFVASTYGSHVSGVDLSSEYIETGTALCEWVKLDDRIHLMEASALSMPFKDASFKGSYMMHVGMNIEDKTKLFTEVFRVLKPEAVFGIYDIMQIQAGDIKFPVPWASEANTSYVASPESYEKALLEAGFKVSKRRNRQSFAMDFFKTLQEKTKANGGPPPLGLHTLMKDTTSIKIKNMIESISKHTIAPVEIIAQKP